MERPVGPARSRPGLVIRLRNLGEVLVRIVTTTPTLPVVGEHSPAPGSRGRPEHTMHERACLLAAGQRLVAGNLQGWSGRIAGARVGG